MTLNPVINHSILTIVIFEIVFLNQNYRKQKIRSQMEADFSIL